MSLSEKLEELNKKGRRKYNTYCAYQDLVNKLSEKDRQTLEDAWAKNYPTYLIIKALRAEGYKTSTDSVRAHMEGDCRCPK